MKEFQIKTAQNISINQNTANVGTRILAYLLDGAIMVFYVIFIFYIGREALFTWSVYSLLFLPVLLYHLLFESFMDGQSPGKKVMNIRVVRLDGSKPTLSNYLIRWLLRFVDISLTSGGVAIITILITGKGQRVGDVAAGTTVVSEKFSIGLHETLLQEIPEDYVPKYPQVMNLSDQQIQQIKQIKSEALKSGDFTLIKQLAEKTAALLQLNPEEKSLAFLEHIIQDYNYYAQRG
ncbi:MAG: RDD family protein [Mongoliitalea sp.]